MSSISVAPIQITAEQILLEAFERQADIYFRPIREEITDEVDLADYLVRRRREYEDKVGRSPTKPKYWIEYASFELSMQDLRRMRSIMERSLIPLYTDIKIWLAYAELELKAGNLPSALTVFQRATSTLPRQDKLWIVYLDVLRRAGKSVEEQREVWNKWMEWHPEVSVWIAFAEFELTFGDLEHINELLSKLIAERPNLETFKEVVKFLKIRVKNLEMAIIFAKKAIEHDLISSLANLEVFFELIELYSELKNLNECRKIFNYLLPRVAEEDKQKVGSKWVNFERKFGNPEEIDAVVYLCKKTFCQSKIELIQSNHDVDSVCDLIQLEISSGDQNNVVQIFDQIFSFVIPPSSPKYFKYVELLIFYANFCEVELKNEILAQNIYEKCLEILPFNQIRLPFFWKAIALFYVRRSQLEKARNILNFGLSINFDDVLIQFYIDLENSLGNVELVSNLYMLWRENSPEKFD
ncbi:hypothetical protein RCL1_003069 [Eukaryota sp. TZLM3-RCL]